MSISWASAAGAGAAVVALGLGGLVALAEDRATTAPLRELDDPLEPPPRLYRLPRRTAASDRAPAARARVGRTTLLFHDVDGNGSFADVGVDGWRLDDDDLPYLLPLEEHLVLDGVRTSVVPDAEAGHVRVAEQAPAWPDGSASLEGVSRKDRAQIEDALSTWNRLRMRNGLMPVHLDPMLTAACMDHARYMERWGVTHDQDAEREGYSPEGARVARSGCVGALPASEEIVEAYATFYHRISFFHPDTRGAGIGSSGSRSVFNGTEDRERRPWSWPVIVPAPGVGDQPRVYHSEKPQVHADLVADGTMPEPGFPITLTFERDAITGVDAMLRAGGADGRDVPFALSWPERPASPDAPTNYKSICLLPHAPLKPRTTYWVHVEWTYRGELDQRTWTFETGR